MSHLGCVDSGDKLQRRKKGAWSLGERQQGHMPEQRVGERLRGAPEETAPALTGSLGLRIFICFPKVRILEEVAQEDLNRIFITFQVCHFRVIVSTDWLALG